MVSGDDGFHSGARIIGFGQARSDERAESLPRDLRVIPDRRRNDDMFRKNSIRNNNGTSLDQRPFSLENFWFAIPLIASLLLTQTLFTVLQEPGSAALTILVYAATTLVSALLLTPLDSEFSLQSLWRLARRCALAAMIFMTLVLIDPQTSAQFAQTLPTTALLFVALLGALSLVLAFTRHRTDARQIVFGVCVALLSAPIWLGPLAEFTGNTPVLSNLIVGVSPLSAFAVSLDFDYLRTSWFYKHSVLGSLRYEYYSWPSYLMIMSAMIAGFAFRASGVKFTPLAHLYKKRDTTL